jgi:hypothetical protein
MKKLFAILLLGVLYSCQPKSVQRDGGVILEIEVGDSLSSSSDIAKTIEILKKRVESICSVTSIFTVNGKTVHIEMPLISDTLICTTFLIQKGEFEISRTYKAIEVLEYLTAINKKLVENNNYGLQFPNDSSKESENPLLDLISIPEQQMNGGLQNGPDVGFVLPKDTALINAVFRHPQLNILMPRDLVFMWARERKSVDQQLYKLIAVKTQINRKIITTEMIEDAKMFQKNGPPQINIVFKPDFHQLWKRFTRENIGASLAMIIDNEVVTYPTVQNEIPNGNSSITGNYTTEEAKALAALLKNGVMPLTVKIIKMTLVKGK